MHKSRRISRLVKLLFALLLMGSAELPGQSQLLDLRKDRAFFNEQIPTFENWLKETGLDPALQVSKVAVDSHKVSLILHFNYADKDSAASAWNELSRSFNKVSALALEERLFYKMAFVMELPYEQAEIQILNLPAFGQIPALDFSIYYDAVKEKIGRKGAFRTKVDEEVFIPAFVLDTAFVRQFTLSNAGELTEQFRYQLNTEIAYRLKNYFEKKTEKQYVFLQSKNPVILEVMNVKSEVIPPGLLSFTNPNERLLISIDHKPTAKGIQFFCTIDGKYGNGLIKPRSLLGFRDMSPEYSGELKRYAKVFTNERLYNWATQIVKQ